MLFFNFCKLSTLRIVYILEIEVNECMNCANSELNQVRLLQCKYNSTKMGSEFIQSTYGLQYSSRELAPDGQCCKTS